MAKGPAVPREDPENTVAVAKFAFILKEKASGSLWKGESGVSLSKRRLRVY